MNSRTVRGLFSLIRPLNVGIAAVAAGGAVVLGGGSWHEAHEILIGMVTAALVTSGANAINDYFDHAIDRINRPERPIPRGDVTRSQAAAVWALSSAVGISVNIFLHWGALAIVAGCVAVLAWYSAYWKRTVLAGNLVVSLMIGMTFVYGGVVGGDLRKNLIPAVFAALLTLAREILKDIEDIEGDIQGNAETFPVRYGKTRAMVLVTTVLAVLSVALWVPVATGFYGLLYSLLVIPLNVALVVVVAWMWKDTSPVGLRRQSSLLKGSMIMGLVAVIVGSL